MFRTENGRFICFQVSRNEAGIICMLTLSHKRQYSSHLDTGVFVSPIVGAFWSKILDWGGCLGVRFLSFFHAKLRTLPPSSRSLTHRSCIRWIQSVSCWSLISPPTLFLMFSTPVLVGAFLVNQNWSSDGFWRQILHAKPAYLLMKSKHENMRGREGMLLR